MSAAAAAAAAAAVAATNAVVAANTAQIAARHSGPSELLPLLVVGSAILAALAFFAACLALLDWDGPRWRWAALWAAVFVVCATAFAALLASSVSA